MAIREELILEIKANLEELKNAVSEIKEKLKGTLEFKKAKEDLRQVKERVEEIKHVSESLRRSPFRKWLEDLTFATELIENLRTVWEIISATSPFTRGIKKLSELETSLYRIAGVLTAAGNSAEVLKEKLSQLEEKRIKLELKGKASEQLNKIEQEIQRIETEIENLSGAPKDFTSALEEARKAQELLRKEALKSVATYDQLALLFTNIAQAALSAGLTIEQTVSLSRLLVETAYMLGYNLEQDIAQLAQSAQAFLRGQKTELNQILGVSEQVIQSWRQQGTLYENLVQKLSGITQAGESVQTTFYGILQKAKEIYDYFSRIASQPLFEAIKKDLQSLNNLLFGIETEASSAGEALGDVANPQVVQAFKTLGIAAREVYESLKAIGSGALQAIRDITAIFSPLINFLRQFYTEHENLIKTILKAVGYIGTIAIMLSPLGRVLNIVRFLVFAFTRLGVIVRGVIALFRGASVSEIIAGWSAALSRFAQQFMQLGAIGKAIIVSLFIKLGEVLISVFNYVKEAVSNFFGSIINFIEKFFNKVKEFFGIGEEKKISLNLDTTMAENKLQQLKEIIKNTPADIKLKADDSDISSKIRKLATTDVKKEVTFVADARDVEETIYNLEQKEITIPVRFVPVGGDYTPGWEE